MTQSEAQRRRTWGRGVRHIGMALTAMLLTAAGCGTKDPEAIPVKLTFSGQNPFKLSNLKDILFIVTYSDSGSTVRLVFPSECSRNDPTISGTTGCVLSPLNESCGYPPSTTKFDLSLNDVALGTTATLTVCGRDTSGTILFSGTSDTFKNSSTIGTVTVPVTIP